MVASSTPRLGGNTRRGGNPRTFDCALAPNPTGGGAAREAVRTAQLVTWCAAGRTPWAHTPKGVDVWAALNGANPRGTVFNNFPVFLNTPPLNQENDVYPGDLCLVLSSDPL